MKDVLYICIRTRKLGITKIPNSIYNSTTGYAVNNQNEGSQVICRT